MRRKLIVLGAVLAVLILLPFIMDGEHLDITPQVRTRLQGEGHHFAAVEAGHIHYELGGPEKGPLVVLVHGVSGPMEAWDEVIAPLQAAGFRTLRFDHFGRGWSDRVERHYDLDLFVSSLEQLLTQLNLQERPLRLVGSSMGAIVCSEFTLRHPERVHKLALLGPAGFPIEAGVLAKFIKVPGAGDYLMKVFGDRNLAAHNRKYFVHPERFGTFQERYERQLEVVGTKAAILSTMRHTPVQSYLDGYRKLGASGKAILIGWGRGDTVFPFAYHQQAQEAMPKAEIFPIEEAGHLPMLEQPAIVLERLLPFLDKS